VHHNGRALAGRGAGRSVMEKPQPDEASRGYEKPAVESEEVFETLALACAKTDAQCGPPGGVAVAQS
jgi:hypothetical protein